MRRAYVERIWNPTIVDTRNTGVDFLKVSQTNSPVLALSRSVFFCNQAARAEQGYTGLANAEQVLQLYHFDTVERELRKGERSEQRCRGRLAWGTKSLPRAQCRRRRNGIISQQTGLLIRLSLYHILCGNDWATIQNLIGKLLGMNTLKFAR